MAKDVPGSPRPPGQHVVAALCLRVAGQGMHVEITVPPGPVACREYLVTSPATFCADPASGKVEGVPRPLRVNAAMMAADPESPRSCVALSVALDWVDRHPPPEPLMPGPTLLRRFLTALFERELPEQGQSLPDDAAPLTALAQRRIIGTAFSREPAHR